MSRLRRDLADPSGQLGEHVVAFRARFDAHCDAALDQLGRSSKAVEEAGKAEGGDDDDDASLAAALAAAAVAHALAEADGGAGASAAAASASPASSA